MAREERTEKATPKHRQRAREKGQVARSPDLGGSTVLIAGLFAISLMGPRIVDAGAATFREIFAKIANPDRALSAAGLNGLLHSALATIALAVAPVAGACLLAGLATGVAQVGFKPNAQGAKARLPPHQPGFGAAQPAEPQHRLRDAQGPREGRHRGRRGSTCPAARPNHPVCQGGHAAKRARIFDGQSERPLDRPTHRLRLRDRGTGRLRLEAAQPRAHVAHDQARGQGRDTPVRHLLGGQERVAPPPDGGRAAAHDGGRAQSGRGRDQSDPLRRGLGLRRFAYQAPEVIAKGKDLMALQIKRIAEENDVPVVADPPLARALHSSTEIGQIIPQELYAAVAQVLAFVYRLAGRRKLAS